jgi:hypothetical protein
MAPGNFAAKPRTRGIIFLIERRGRPMLVFDRLPVGTTVLRSDLSMGFS